MLDIVTVTSLYPNVLQPRHGIFVEQRLLQLVATGAVQARVVAPVPWFPSAGKSFGRYGVYARVPVCEVRHGISVAHPRYLVVPKIGMHIAPALMVARLLPYFRALHVRARRPFVLDGHFLYPDGVALVLIGQALGIPVVLTARGSDVNLYGRYPGPRAMIRWAALRCAKVIAVSSALRMELTKLGVPEQCVEVMRNGVDTQLFVPMDAALARRETGYTGFTLLCVGNLVSLKGHDLVIDAVSRLPDVRLVIIGEGPCEGALRRQVIARGLRKRVTMIPNIPQGELVSHYNSADAVVLASSEEGMPNVVLESLACGTPVVVTNVGGIPEVVTSPDAGVIVRERSADALVDAIERLRRNYPDVAKTRAHAIQFGWAPTVNGVLNVLRNALPSKQASTG